MKWLSRLKLPTPAPVFVPERELAPGVVRPSTILAELVCAELLGPNFSPERVADPRPLAKYDSYSETMKWTWKCDKFTIQIQRYSGRNFYDCHTSSLFFGVVFNDYEEKLIRTALNRGFELLAERQRIKRDSDGQQKALDYIEKMWTKPEAAEGVKNGP